MNKRVEARGSLVNTIQTDRRIETKVHAVDRDLERIHMKKNEETSKENLLKKIRAGLRLKTKAPAVIRDRSRYTRKSKHPMNGNTEE